MFVSGMRYFVLFQHKQTLAAILIMPPDIVNSLYNFYGLPGPDNTGLCYTANVPDLFTLAVLAGALDF